MVKISCHKSTPENRQLILAGNLPAAAEWKISSGILWTEVGADGMAETIVISCKPWQKTFIKPKLVSINELGTTFRVLSNMAESGTLTSIDELLLVVESAK